MVIPLRPMPSSGSLDQSALNFRANLGTELNSGIGGTALT